MPEIDIVAKTGSSCTSDCVSHTVDLAITFVILDTLNIFLIEIFLIDTGEL